MHVAQTRGRDTIGRVDVNLPTPGISAERRLAEPLVPAAVIVRELLLLAAGALFLALTAQISAPAEWPVPITGQTLGVLLIGALYGPRRGALTVIAYLAEGLAGLPVFAFGRSGLATLLGPTGGFLLGFVPAAFIAGFASAGRRPAVRLALLLLASVVIYAAGIPWLMVVLALPLEGAFKVGVLRFIPGDVLKAGLAAGVTPAGSRLLAALPGFRRR